MYQYEMNDQYASDFTLIRKEHAIESINDFSSFFVSPKPTAPFQTALVYAATKMPCSNHSVH